MPEHHQPPYYPLEVTEREARSGFARMDVFRLVDPDFGSQWTSAVAKSVGMSGLVLKIDCPLAGIGYIFRIYGVLRMVSESGIKMRPSWHPVGGFHKDHSQALFEAEIGASEVDGLDIVPRPAQLR